MKSNCIPISVMKRMPKYYRFLEELSDVGVRRISSRELSEKTGFTASQIRQDLSALGGFGQQGYGYNVDLLKGKIGHVLGLEKKYPAILIGAGSMGRDVALNVNFERRGFSLIGVFDSNQAVAGRMVGGLPVRHIDTLDDFCRENFPEAAVLCLSPEAARNTVISLKKLGVKAFWNLSGCEIISPDSSVKIENVHLGDSLMALCSKMNPLAENEDFIDGGDTEE